MCTRITKVIQGAAVSGALFSLAAVLAGVLFLAGCNPGPANPKADSLADSPTSQATESPANPSADPPVNQAAESPINSTADIASVPELLVTSARLTTAGNKTCLAGQDRIAAQIKRVTDGDTVVLSDGSRVRIIGINTLEMNASTAADRDLAQRATQIVKSLIDGQTVSLVAGVERYDQHQRKLAHIQFGPDNTRDIASVLLQQGLASAIAVSPNTRCSVMHANLETGARRGGLGIWAVPGNWFTDNNPIQRGAQGFKVMTTRIMTVKQQSRYTTLALANGVTATLGRYWPEDVQINTLRGKRVELRGWLGNRDGKPTLNLHHPVNVRLLHD